MIIEFIRISFIKSNLFYRMLIISHKDEALLVFMDMMLICIYVITKT